MSSKMTSKKLKGKNISKNKLFDEDPAEENEEETGSLRVNKSYATKYDEWRSKEELQKLKDRYGDNPENEEDSSSSSDSDEEMPDNIFGKEFLATLSCLKSKDPKIYDENYRFFTNEGESSTQNKKKKDKKPLFLRDYERETLLKYNGELPDEEKDDLEMKLKFDSESKYDEEQREIKEKFKLACNSESDEDDDLLTLRTKSEKEKKTEDDEFAAWLKGRSSELEKETSVKDMKYLREFWNDPSLSKEEEFLKDFILEKKYIDPREKKRVPTYDEIVKEEEEEEENEFSDEQDNFERKYNFRFEEPDEEFIKRYPRTMQHSMRRKDTRRTDKRLEIRERKLKEKQQKREDLKRLKALKRKEIMDKISKIKEITGNTKIGFEDIDLDGDFDPATHDAKMSAVFNDNYYEDEAGDEMKPEFPEDEGDDYHEWDKWEVGNEADEGDYNEELNYEDPNFNMDCDYDPSAEICNPPEEFLSKRKMKKRQSKLWGALRKKKPVFNPSDNTFEEYFDEYYKLDYEDIIDDLPCRFKYRKVIPNDFGLSVDEILKADDRELNQWSSLKKTCQIRSEEEEKYDIKAYAKKAQHVDKKKKILKSVYETTENDAEEAVEEPDEEKKNKRKRRQSGTNESVEVNSKSENKKEETETISKSQKKRQRKKRRMNNPREQQMTEKADTITDDRLKAYGINPKKYRNKQKYASQRCKN